MKFVINKKRRKKKKIMCSLVAQSCCISLETRLVLKSDYTCIKQFSIFVCVTVVLANVSCGLIDVQAAT